MLSQPHLYLIPIAGLIAFAAGFIHWWQRYQFLNRREYHYRSAFFLCWLGGSLLVLSIITWIMPAKISLLIPEAPSITLPKTIAALLIATTGLLASTSLQILIMTVRFAMISQALSPHRLFQSYTVQVVRAMAKIRPVSLAIAAFANSAIIMLLL